MKDNFMHCRVAGLRTANACVKLLDAAQMASKLIPQASILLLDKSAEVRSLAFTLIESCLEALRGNHEAMTAKAKAESGGSGGVPGVGTPSKHDSSFSFSGTAGAAPGSAARSSSAGSATTGEGDAAGSGWSSWSVLQGISKTLESATIVGGVAASDNVTGPTHTNLQHGNNNSSSSTTLNKDSAGVGAVGAGDSRKGLSVLKNSSSMASTTSGDSMMVSGQQHQRYGGGSDADDLDFDPDMHDHDDRCYDDEVDNHHGDDNNGGHSAGSSKKGLSGKKDSFRGTSGGKSQQQKGWDDDLDIDIDMDSGDDDGDDGDASPPKASLMQAKSSVSGGMQLGSLGASSVVNKQSTMSAPRGMSLKADKDKTTAGKAPKVAVTKLSVNKGEDNWDDF